MYISWWLIITVGIIFAIVLSQKQSKLDSVVGKIEDPVWRTALLKTELHITYLEEIRTDRLLGDIQEIKRTKTDYAKLMRHLYMDDVELLDHDDFPTDLKERWAMLNTN